MIRRGRRAIIALIVATYFASSSVMAVGNFDLFSKPFYDAEDVSCSSDTTTTTSKARSVYLVGDSIGNRAKSALKSEITSSGGQFFADALDSRNLSGTPPSPDGLAAVDQDKSDIKTADAVVVELGTNTSGFSGANVDSMIKKITAINPSASIYWVDTAVANRPGYVKSLNQVNSIIYDRASADNYQVISWNKAVFGDNADPTNIDPGAKDKNNYIDNSDGLGVHPSNDKGVPALASLIAKSVSSGGSQSDSVSGNSCSCKAGSTNLSGNSTRLKIMNFLVGKGLSPTQAAGVVGNMTHESGLEPKRQEGIFSRLVSAENFPDPAGGPGWGLVQWTPGTKMINTFKPASDANDLGNQLNFLWHQLDGTGPVAEYPQILKDIKSVGDGDFQNAVLAFQGNTSSTAGQYAGHYVGFERPANEAASVPARIRSARDALTAYSSGGGAVSPGVTQTNCSGTDSGSNPITGSGTGKFTTDTNAKPYPGLDSMLKYAKQVAQTSYGRPLPKATQEFCALLAGGTCAFSCESAAEEVWLKHRGVYPNPYSQPPNGRSTWEVISSAKGNHAHPGDRNPPVGALLIYTNAGNPLGHVAVYMGNNLVFSTDLLGGGSVYIGSADKIESAGWNMTYVGWADPYFNGVVGNP